MTKISLKSDVNTDSYWIGAVDRDSLVKIGNDFMEGNPEKITELLLQEFHNTSQDLKEKFRPLILEWLSNVEKDKIGETEFSELRTHIYEMF